MSLASVREPPISRAQRFLAFFQALRRHRRAVAGAMLAEELSVSPRTLYCDIDTLNAQRAHIEGEAGVGHVLRSGFMLPPLMCSGEEVEALAPGSPRVSQRADGLLGRTARTLPAKVGAAPPRT